MPQSHRTYGPLDDPALGDTESGGDVAFVGVDMATEPGLLPPGMVASAENVRFDGGEAQTRGGLWELTNQNAGATAAGAVLFSNPNGYEAILVATASGVQIVRDGAPVQTVSISDQAMPADAELVQCFDRVLLFRGEDRAPLEWDGAPTTQFEAISQTSTGTGTQTIPNAPFAVAMANRLFVPRRIGERLDCIAVSDPLDYTRYVAQIQEFRINFGTSDDITALVPYGKSSLVVFKQSSVAYLTGVVDDLSGIAAGEATRAVGCIARHAVSEVGNRLWFLGQGGVFELQPTGSDEEKFAVNEQPVSWPMRPFFARVNWRAAAIACSAVDDERYYLALPIDGATRNNAVAIYNFISRRWEGFHTFAATVDLRFWVPADWLGRRRLWVIDRTGRALIYGEHLDGDWFASTSYAIATSLTTRGYLRAPARRRFTGWQVQAATWRASLTVTTATDGVNETATGLSALTASRTAFLAGETETYDLTNASDNHDAPYREDYSVIGNDNFAPRSGAKVELHAERTYRGPLRGRGHSLAVTVTNSTGSVRLLGISAEAAENDRANRNYP